MRLVLYLLFCIIVVSIFNISVLRGIFDPSKRIEVDEYIRIDIPSSFRVVEAASSAAKTTTSTSDIDITNEVTTPTTTTTTTTGGSLHKPILTNLFPPHKVDDVNDDEANNNNGNRAGEVMFQDAVDECNSIQRDIGYYPSIMSHLIGLRQEYWDDHNRIFQMAEQKLGDKVYSSFVNVRSPQIYFCGKSIDLPRTKNIVFEFGNNFVLKPVFGQTAKGVKVIWNGQLKGPKQEEGANVLSYDSLIEEYGPETYLIVEELAESPNPNLKAEGLIPPDYKFFAYSSQHIGDQKYHERDQPETTGKKNKLVLSCAIRLRIHHEYYDDNNNKSSSSNIKDYKFEPMIEPHRSYKQCDLHDDDKSQDGGLTYGSSHESKTRRKEMMEAVQRLSQYLNDDYIRVDMFDSSKGPTLGEFTPYPANGYHEAFSGCVHSYLFIHHAMKSKVSDDAQLVLRHLINNREEKIDLYRPKIGVLQKNESYRKIHKALRERIRTWIPYHWTNNTLNEFYEDMILNNNNNNVRPKPPRRLQEVADRWSNFTMQEKCDQAMLSQREFFEKYQKN